MPVGCGDGDDDGDDDALADGDGDGEPGDGLVVARVDGGQSRSGISETGISTSTPGWPSRATQSRP